MNENFIPAYKVPITKKLCMYNARVKDKMQAKMEERRVKAPAETPQYFCGESQIGNVL